MAAHLVSADAYQFLFSIPAKGALNMGSEGGGVLKVEFSQESSEAIVAMIQRAIVRGGCVFAAAVVEVEPEGLKAPKVRKWNEPKLKK